METEYLLQLGIILIATKASGILMKAIGMPQVVGALVAGIIVGPMVFGLVQSSDVLDIIAEIGVIMIIFSAGLETNVKELKKTGKASLVIAAGGVIVPLILGFLIAALFHGGFNFDRAELIKNIFFGLILTATSISIAVQTLKELGKLKSKSGTIILSAAIIDDIIGIIMVSIMLGFNNAAINPWITIGKTLLFFALLVIVGIPIHKLFKYFSGKYPRNRRIPIFALGICLILAYVAEKVFGVADITGAYFAGVIFSGISVSSYIERKIDINSYMFFAPVFFAYIGIKASFVDFDASLILFALAFVSIGIISKIIGCYSTSRMCHLDRQDSKTIAFAMIARGEVALVVMQKAVNESIIESKYLAVVVALVIATSIIAPILLKLTSKNDTQNNIIGSPTNIIPQA